MSEEKQILINMIFAKYNTLSLSKKQCSEVVGRSCSSLDRDRAQCIGISFNKEDNGNIYYPVSRIVDWLLDNSVQTQ